MTTISPNIRELVLNKIQSVEPDAEILLYGSRARGDFKKDSDWDLIIILQTNAIGLRKEEELLDLIYDIELETGEVISPLIYSRSDWYLKHKHSPFYKSVNKDAVRIS